MSMILDEEQAQTFRAFLEMIWKEADLTADYDRQTFRLSIDVQRVGKTWYIMHRQLERFYP